MNYLKVYCNLIRKAEDRNPPRGYTEKHHIFPKSIFGNNNRIVILTAREHYIAHALLEKIYIKRYGLTNCNTIKMTYAHTCMKANGNYVNSYLYENARIRRNTMMKNKIWITDGKCDKLANENEIPSGWNPGRISKFSEHGAKLNIKRMLENNPNSKKYKIHFIDGTKKVVEPLSSWARKNGYNYSTIKSIVRRTILGKEYRFNKYGIEKIELLCS